jgi:hypothetical protein
MTGGMQRRHAPTAAVGCAGCCKVADYEVMRSGIMICTIQLEPIWAPAARPYVLHEAVSKCRRAGGQRPRTNAKPNNYSEHKNTATEYRVVTASRTKVVWDQLTAPGRRGRGRVPATVYRHNNSIKIRGKVRYYRIRCAQVAGDDGRSCTLPRLASTRPSSCQWLALWTIGHTEARPLRVCLVWASDQNGPH